MTKDFIDDLIEVVEVKKAVKNSSNDFNATKAKSFELAGVEVQIKLTISDEHKRRIGEATRGRVVSEETKRKIGEAQKGKIISEETRIKMSESHKGENHHFYGKTLSEEHRRKMSEAMEGEKNPNFGKKWWNDGCGNRKMMIECPGDGWKLGRK